MCATPVMIALVTRSAGGAGSGRGSGRCGARRRTAPRTPASCRSSERRAAADTVCSSSWAIVPSLRCTHAPTISPSTHSVGPPLPLRSNTSAPCAPRYHDRPLQPIVVGSSPGSTAVQCPGGPTTSRSSGSSQPGSDVVDRHGDGGDVGERLLRRGRRGTHPPAQIVRRHRPEPIQDTAHEGCSCRTGIQPPDPARHHGVHRPPLVLTVDPRACRLAAHDRAVEAEQQQHSRVRRRRRRIRLADSHVQRRRQRRHLRADAPRARRPEPVQRGEHVALGGRAATRRRRW